MVFSYKVIYKFRFFLTCNKLFKTNSHPGQLEAARDWKMLSGLDQLFQTLSFIFVWELHEHQRFLFRACFTSVEHCRQSKSYMLSM